MTNLTVLSNRDPTPEIRNTLEFVADVLGVEICWLYRGGFHFKLTGEWTISITPETAGRVRVETWWMLLARDRKWAMSDDRNRLGSLVRDALETAMQPA